MFCGLGKLVDLVYMGFISPWEMRLRHLGQMGHVVIPSRVDTVVLGEAKAITAEAGLI